MLRCCGRALIKLETLLIVQWGERESEISYAIIPEAERQAKPNLKTEQALYQKAEGSVAIMAAPIIGWKKASVKKICISSYFMRNRRHIKPIVNISSSLERKEKYIFCRITVNPKKASAWGSIRPRRKIYLPLYKSTGELAKAKIYTRSKINIMKIVKAIEAAVRRHVCWPRNKEAMKHGIASSLNFGKLKQLTTLAEMNRGNCQAAAINRPWREVVRASPWLLSW